MTQDVLVGRSNINSYWCDIKRTQPLAADEEKRLAALAHAGSVEARNRLVEANLRFVVSIAKFYLGRGLAMNELVSEGNAGLMIAAGKFDETRGLKFITYAVWWIRQSILQALSEHNRLSGQPHNHTSDAERVYRTIERLAQDVGHWPDSNDVREASGLSDARWLNAHRAMSPYRSLDVACYEDGPAALIDLLESDERDVATALEVNDDLDRLHTLLSRLNAREAVIVSAYYGFGGEEPKTLEEIGVHIGRTRERVRQIRDRALKRIRVWLQEEGITTTMDALLPGWEQP